MKKKALSGNERKRGKGSGGITSNGILPGMVRNSNGNNQHGMTPDVRKLRTVNSDRALARFTELKEMKQDEVQALLDQEGDDALNMEELSMARVLMATSKDSDPKSLQFILDRTGEPIVVEPELAETNKVLSMTRQAMISMGNEILASGTVSKKVIEAEVRVG